MMKIKIWAPWPYEVICLRGCSAGDTVLNDENKPVVRGSPSPALYPILGYSPGISVQEVVHQGVIGRFRQHREDDWGDEYLLMQKMTIAENHQRDLLECFTDPNGTRWNYFKPERVCWEVEAPVPEGYEPVRYGRPKEGELHILNEDGPVEDHWPLLYDVLVVKRRTYRTATSDDLGKQCRFSKDGENWTEGTLTSLTLLDGELCFKRQFTPHTYFKYCEVYDA